MRSSERASTSSSASPTRTPTSDSSTTTPTPSASASAAVSDASGTPSAITRSRACSNSPRAPAAPRRLTSSRPAPSVLQLGRDGKSGDGPSHEKLRGGGAGWIAVAGAAHPTRNSAASASRFGIVPGYRLGTDRQGALLVGGLSRLMRPMSRRKRAPHSVGENVARAEGVEKLTGQARYLDDLTFDGCLYGATVRSTIAHGRIVAVERDPGFDWDGFVIADHRDVRAKN